MTSYISQRTFVIEWGVCDPAGIVFNSRFFEMFDQATWLLFERALGVPRAGLSASCGIMGFPLVDARARFVLPVKFGDTIEMTSQVIEFRRSSFDVEHRLSVAGELAVEGSETRVWAARDKDDPERIKSKAVPPEVIARFKSA
jgi:4-hydroxybenzoyl-CoA thioesterase